MINFVDASNLKETAFNKKDFNSKIKDYVKKLKAALDADPTKKERVPIFMKGVTELVKYVNTIFD